MHLFFLLSPFVGFWPFYILVLISFLPHRSRAAFGCRGTLIKSFHVRNKVSSLCSSNRLEIVSLVFLARRRFRHFRYSKEPIGLMRRTSHDLYKVPVWEWICSGDMIHCSLFIFTSWQRTPRPNRRPCCPSTGGPSHARDEPSIRNAVSQWFWFRRGTSTSRHHPDGFH